MTTIRIVIFLSFFLWIWSPGRPSLSIIGWYYIYNPMVVLVPPVSLSLPFSPFYPLPEVSRVPCPLQFARFLSVSFASSPSVSLVAPPPTSPAAFDSPSSVWWVPPVASSGGRKQINSPLWGWGSGALRFWCVTALCGWWYLALVWVGGV